MYFNVNCRAHFVNINIGTYKLMQMCGQCLAMEYRNVKMAKMNPQPDAQ